MSYHELNMLANRLAHRLVAGGVGVDVPVPVFAERAPDAIIAMLAVLKAGGAYVPLDAALPTDRIRQVLDEFAEAAIFRSGLNRLLILTQRHLASHLPPGDHDIVFIEDARIGSKPSDDVNPEPSAGSDDLAYIMFTSGSTGRPKGVMVTHGNLLNSTLARPHFYRDAPTSFLMLSSIATDSSVAGIFWSLYAGGCLILPRPHLEQDLMSLAALLADRRVSHMLCVPSFYQLVLEHCDPSDLESLEAQHPIGGRLAHANVVSTAFDEPNAFLRVDAEKMTERPREADGIGL